MADFRGLLGRRMRALRAAWSRAGVEGVAMLALGSGLLPRKLLFVHDIDVLVLAHPKGRDLVPLRGEYEFAVADPSILDDLIECTDGPDATEARRQALARVLDLGPSCLTVRSGGLLVAYLCAFRGKYTLTYDDYGPKTIVLELDDNAVFLGNLFIRPEHRMKGLFPHLLRYCTEGHPEGTRFFGHVDADNVHSFNSHRRIGFVPLLTVTCLGIGPARFFFQRPFGARRRRQVAQHSPQRLVEREGGLVLAAE